MTWAYSYNQGLPIFLYTRAAIRPLLYRVHRYYLSPDKVSNLVCPCLFALPLTDSRRYMLVSQELRDLHELTPQRLSTSATGDMLSVFPDCQDNL